LNLSFLILLKLFFDLSIAKSLGAKTCASKLFEYYQEYKENIESIVLSDREVVEAMSKFLGKLF
jgi:hypothetical protein